MAFEFEEEWYLLDVVGRPNVVLEESTPSWDEDFFKRYKSYDFYDSREIRSGVSLDKSEWVSPKKQAKLGVEIWCKPTLVLITKSDGTPACVNFKTKEILIYRGWAKGDTSFATKILDELRKGPQEVNGEQANFIKNLVMLNDTVSEFLKQRNWDSTCCAYISDESANRIRYGVGINFFDKENQKQLLAVLDLDTLQVTDVSIGNMTFHEPPSLRVK